MEVDPSNTVSTIPVNLWCFLGKDGTKQVKAALDVSNLTFDNLKNFVCEQIGGISPNEIDILYNGGKLKNDGAVKAAVFQPLNIITIIKQTPTVDKSSVDVSASKNIMDQIPQVALALRTAFFNPNFIPTIEKLGNSDMLENIMAIATGLKDDPVGIAIIQDPAMIYHLSDVESLKKLAATKPWVVEAFNFLAASVHQEKGQTSGNRNVPAMFNPAFFEGEDDDDMDEGDDAEVGAGSSRQITREQLSAALNSLNALGRSAFSSASSGSPSQNSEPPASLFDLIAQAGAQLPSASALSSVPHQGSSSSDNTGLQGLLSAVLPNNNTQLTPEVVARAMSNALNNLPPGVREQRMNDIREHIARIQNPTATVPASTTPSSNAPTGSTSQNSNPSSSEGTYREQLAQMREMGIHDENLSLLALRVSDGDVGTAVDLIFSGWTGEGADSQMSSED